MCPLVSSCVLLCPLSLSKPTGRTRGTRVWRSWRRPCLCLSVGPRARNWHWRLRRLTPAKRAGWTNERCGVFCGASCPPSRACATTTTTTASTVSWRKGRSRVSRRRPLTMPAVRLYVTCWWYSWCNFQYRQHYENTCSDHFDCGIYTSNFFHLFILCLTYMTSTINTNAFFDFTDFTFRCLRFYLFLSNRR